MLCCTCLPHPVYAGLIVMYTFQQIERNDSVLSHPS